MLVGLVETENAIPVQVYNVVMNVIKVCPVLPRRLHNCTGRAEQTFWLVPARSTSQKVSPYSDSLLISWVTSAAIQVLSKQNCPIS